MPRLSYPKLVPDGSIIADYMAMMEPQETPYAYDFWTACWLVSVAVGRSIHVPRPRAPVFLNLYTILVAQSGVTRKSTAVRHAASMARELLSHERPHVEFIESMIGKDQLELKLAQQTVNRDTAECVIAVSELATFLGKEMYNLGLPALMTDLYDCPAERKSPGTVRSGIRDMKNVCINFLSASTPSWLMRAVNPDVIEGGFTSRCLFVVEEEPKRRTVWPIASDGSSAHKLVGRLVGLISTAERVQHTHGGVGISDAALVRLQRWYRSREEHLDPYRASFEAREDHHAIRLAAILAINDGTWIIHPIHISRAIQVINRVKEDGAGLFSGSLTSSRLVLGVDKARSVLIEAGRGGVTQTNLHHKCRAYLTVVALDTLMNIMHELDLVQRFEVPMNKAGKPTTIWRATKLLLKPKAIAHVMKMMEELPSG